MTIGETKATNEYSKKLRPGVYTEKKLVEIFGSPAQKKCFSEYRTLKGKSYFNTMMKKIKRYCSIEQMKERSANGGYKFKISSIYEYPLPPQFNKMNSGMYQYMIPLMLYCLVNGHDEHHKINLTIGKWAREIKMVNRNYDMIRYNKQKASYELDVNYEQINEYYEKSDSILRYYVLNALDYLKKAGRIIWREAYRIQKMGISNCTLDDNNISSTVQIIESDATDEDMEIYSECIAIADKKANVNNDRERYYSKKSKDFSRYLQQELNERGIRLIYKTYEAYYIDLDKCQDLLSHFELQSMQDFENISKFNQLFAEKMEQYALSRYENNPTKYYEYEKSDDLVKAYGILNDIVLNHNAEKLKFTSNNHLRDEFTSDVQVDFKKK